MDQCASFLAQIFPVICSDAEKAELQRKIFLSLFEFSILNELSDHLSDDTLWGEYETGLRPRQYCYLFI